MQATSVEYQQWQAQQSQGAIIESLPDMTEAMVKRAKRGRTDASKLAMEISGFHNPRVDHKHSGDIKITLATAVPRPTRSSEATIGKELEEGIVDADVVEDA
jgi:hypothetical protein